MSSNREPYASISREELILRDHLAIDRTVLANERTFLAYIRTALAFFLVGGWFLKFFNTTLMHVLAYVSILASAILFFFGVRRYRMTHERIVGRTDTWDKPA